LAQRLVDRLELQAAESLRVAHEAGALRSQDLKRVTVDTTVQVKAITFRPTPSCCMRPPRDSIACPKGMASGCGSPILAWLWAPQSWQAAAQFEASESQSSLQGIPLQWPAFRQIQLRQNAVSGFRINGLGIFHGRLIFYWLFRVTYSRKLSERLIVVREAAS
jgi:hypothetical protein